MFVVCGEALFDLFPEESQSHGGLILDARIGGSPFNVAVGLARLGREAALFTGISTDFLGERLISELREEAVSIEFLVRKPAPTTLSLVGLGADGSPQYVFYGDAAADRLVLPSELPTFSKKVTGVHFGSYSLVAPPIADTLIDLAAREAGRRLISLDPNVRLNVEPDIRVWRRRVEAMAAKADLLKISSEDFEALYPDASVDDMAARWLGLGLGLVVVTRGNAGVRALMRNTVTEIPVDPVTVVDSVGAGDTFQAALLAGVAELGVASGADLRAMDKSMLDRVLAFAAKAAAITCTRRGADLPRRTELGAL